MPPDSRICPACGPGSARLARVITGPLLHGTEVRLLAPYFKGVASGPGRLNTEICQVQSQAPYFTGQVAGLGPRAHLGPDT